MKTLGRLLTAMVTPFDKANEVDYAQACRLALALLDSGSDGVVVSGTTGEAPTLSHAEKLRLFTEIKKAVGQRGDVVAGTGTNNTADSIVLTQEAERIGVDGILLVVPYYNKPTPDGLFEHFAAIARATSLPCIVYNIPGRTGTSMGPDVVIKLSKEVPNIVGIKEASGDLNAVARIVEGARPGFLVWSGNDNDTLPMMAVGGYGVIAVASHLVGKQMKEMIDKFLARDTVDAATIHRRLLPLFQTMFVVSNPIPVKYALNQVGFPVGNTRLPLTPPDAKAAAAIEAEVNKHRIDLPLPAPSRVEGAAIR
ncbi:MAG: 4-hydroxy-tetrahydrodipicolinate synthase [Chloroflexi bacterium]|nr:4-hydroxy-tetrahydrodipicolinate synthase [Chloroflexota bacterium]